MSDDKGGRPAIGPKVPINFPPGLLRGIDEAADLACASRAAWIRRTTARALPETFEGPLTADQLGQYLRGSNMGEDLDDSSRAVHIDGDTQTRLLRAVDDRTLTFGAFTTEALSVDLPGSRRRLSLITRNIHPSPSEAAITIYQVSYSTVAYQQPGELEGVYHRQRDLFLDKDAARTYYEHMRDEYLRLPAA